MPLEKNKEISLIHKEYKTDPKMSDHISSQEVPQSSLLSASFTVEAALVFPIFVWILVGILFFFRVLQVTQTTYGALAQTGSSLSLEKEAVSMEKVIIYFQSRLSGENCSYIVGNRGGIRWNDTILEGEYLDLQIQYHCRLPIQLFNIRYIPIKQRVRMKKWTGYHKESGSENQEVWVYVTPNGSVYHLTRECTHLQLSISTMGKQEVINNGYKECVLCKDETQLYAYYYVTKEGEKYHKKLDCSGLKRTIYMVRLSEVGDRAVCSRCGGME